MLLQKVLSKALFLYAEKNIYNNDALLNYTTFLT